MVWSVLGFVELEEICLMVRLDLQDARRCLFGCVGPRVILSFLSIKASSDARPVKFGTLWLFLGWLKLLDVRDLLLDHRQAQEAPELIVLLDVFSVGCGGGDNDLESVGEGAEVYEL